LGEDRVRGELSSQKKEKKKRDLSNVTIYIQFPPKKKMYTHFNERKLYVV